MSTSNTDTSNMAAVKNSDIGMLAPKPILFLLLWYFFSGLTLFFNKYIVAIMKEFIQYSKSGLLKVKQQVDDLISD